MKATPFIPPIKPYGGQMYSFSSAQEDLSLNINSSGSDKKFRFSKFALLKIPPLANLPAKNTIKLRATQGGYKNPDFISTAEVNSQLIESFQNYCLNLETTILNSPHYRASSDDTVAERVFFKWLKELSAVRFKDTTFPIDIDNNTKGTFFEEESNKDNIYDKVVKYIGEIQLVNTIKSSVNSYTEIHFLVPTSHGSTPTVLFKTKQDTNYFPGLVLSRSDQYANLIQGRTFDSVDSPNGISKQAIYDSLFVENGTESDQTLIGTLELYKKRLDAPESSNIIIDQNGNLVDYITTPGLNWWFDSTSAIPNSYLLQPQKFNDPTNDNLAISSNRGAGGTSLEGNTAFFKRTKLDGISIDWNLSDYKNLYPGIKNFTDLNSGIYSENFEFNAVLIYYDLYRPGLNGGLDTVLATNLYGILFLDKVIQGDPQFNIYGSIPTMKKIAPNSKLGLNGNSIGLKWNIKLDLQPYYGNLSVLDAFSEDSTEVNISDGKTFSMDLFAEAMNQFASLSESLVTRSDAFVINEEKILRLETLLSNVNAPLDSFSRRVSALETYIQSPEKLIALRESSDLLKLIQSLQDDLNQIAKGKTNPRIEFNFDVLKNGSGIDLDKTKQNEVRIVNTVQNYTIGDNYVLKFPDNWAVLSDAYQLEIELKQFKNYIRLSSIDESDWNKNASLQSTYSKKNYRILINDKFTKWKNGQSFRIYFSVPHLFTGKTAGEGITFTFITDAGNILKLPNSYLREICTIRDTDFDNTGRTPIIEFICVDEKQLLFELNILNSTKSNIQGLIDTVNAAVANVTNISGKVQTVLNNSTLQNSIDALAAVVNAINTRLTALENEKLVKYD